MRTDEAFEAEHRAVQEALPWLANGTLDEAERALAEAHLRSCARCRGDLGLLAGLRAAGPGTADEPAPGCDPGRAWARMQAHLDLPAAPPAPPPGILARWRTRAAANERSWLRAAVAVQCCLIAVLAAPMLRPDGDAAYRGLGASLPIQTGIVVVFRPETPERELRRIVRDSGARLSGGPTAGDAWLLDGGDKDAVLARLRREPAVVLAEPLGAENRP